MPQSWLLCCCGSLMPPVKQVSLVLVCRTYPSSTLCPVKVPVMVTAKTQYSLANAQTYFEEHLAVGDYYEQGQTVAGEWFGEGAVKLALTGKVRSEEFLALCENRHPTDGTTLTQRQKS